MAAGIALGVPVLLMAAAGAATPAAPATTTRTTATADVVTVDVRGPMALVQVTRWLPLGARGEVILDLALPEGAALVDVALGGPARWRPAAITEAGGARERYVQELQSRGGVPAALPFDDGVAYRIRVAAGPRGGDGRIGLRYRFSLLPELVDGRHRVRMPPATESLPAPADVRVSARDAADVDIAGVRTTFPGAAGTARGRASTRAAWELSWAPRPGPRPPAAGLRLEGEVAAARLSPHQTAVAVSARARGTGSAGPPGNVLLLIDRSRSVGLPGLSAERELARRLLETLPPATRFEVLFFDRAAQRLFPLSRPATREAISALDAQMVPDRLRNGTDLAQALRDAGALLRREASAFAPRTLLALITDGALPEAQDGAALSRALGLVPGLELTVAAWAIRPRDDEPPPPAAARALRDLAAARGGVYRPLRANELEEALPAALATLGQGGDVGAVRLVVDGQERAVADRLAPGEGRGAVMTLDGPLPRGAELVGVVRGGTVRQAARWSLVDAAWLRPHLGGAAATRLLETPDLLALVEPVVSPAAPPEPVVKGGLDRVVVRNTLSLAFMPRARACYLNRSGATPALRDLTGRVRLAIDLARGEVSSTRVEASTLNQPAIEACLRDGAFEVEVPRALRSDAPVTAVMNLVFRPRTPEKRVAADETALGEQIDLVIDELHRDESSRDESHREENLAPAAPPALDRSLIPTR